MSQSATGARPITPSPIANNCATQDHISACLHSLKSNIESHLSFKMLTPLMKCIKRGQFSQPTMIKRKQDKSLSACEQFKLDAHSISTRDSEDESHMAFEHPQGLSLFNNNHLLFNSPSRKIDSSKTEKIQ